MMMQGTLWICGSPAWVYVADDEPELNNDAFNKVEKGDQFIIIEIHKDADTPRVLWALILFHGGVGWTLFNPDIDVEVET